MSNTALAEKSGSIPTTEIQGSSSAFAEAQPPSEVQLKELQGEINKLREELNMVKSLLPNTEGDIQTETTDKQTDVITEDETYQPKERSPYALNGQSSYVDIGRYADENNISFDKAFMQLRSGSVNGTGKTPDTPSPSLDSTDSATPPEAKSPWEQNAKRMRMRMLGLDKNTRDEIENAIRGGHITEANFIDKKGNELFDRDVENKWNEELKSKINAQKQASRGIGSIDEANKQLELQRKSGGAIDTQYTSTDTSPLSRRETSPDIEDKKNTATAETPESSETPAPQESRTSPIERIEEFVNNKGLTLTDRMQTDMAREIAVAEEKGGSLSASEAYESIMKKNQETRTQTAEHPQEDSDDSSSKEDSEDTNRGSPAFTRVAGYHSGEAGDQKTTEQSTDEAGDPPSDRKEAANDDTATNPQATSTSDTGATGNSHGKQNQDPNYWGADPNRAKEILQQNETNGVQDQEKNQGDTTRQEAPEEQGQADVSESDSSSNKKESARARMIGRMKLENALALTDTKFSDEDREKLMNLYISGKLPTDFAMTENSQYDIDPKEFIRRANEALHPDLTLQETDDDKFKLENSKNTDGRFDLTTNSPQQEDTKSKQPDNSVTPEDTLAQKLNPTEETPPPLQLKEDGTPERFQLEEDKNKNDTRYDLETEGTQEDQPPEPVSSAHQAQENQTDTSDQKQEMPTSANKRVEIKGSILEAVQESPDISQINKDTFSQFIRDNRDSIDYGKFVDKDGNTITDPNQIITIMNEINQEKDDDTHSGIGNFFNNLFNKPSE